MMKTLLLLTCILSSCAIFDSQEKAPTFQQFYSQLPAPSSLVQLPDDSYIISGTTSSNRINIIGVDPFGELKWSTILDSSKTYYYCFDMILLDSVVFVLGGANVNNDWDSFLALLSFTGDTIWTRRFDMGQYDWAYSAALMANGNIVVAGSISDDSYSYLLVISQQGDTLWSQTPLDEIYTTVTAHPDGSFSTCGSSLDDESFIVEEFSASGIKTLSHAYHLLASSSSISNLDGSTLLVTGSYSGKPRLVAISRQGSLVWRSDTPGSASGSFYYSYVSDKYVISTGIENSELQDRGIVAKFDRNGHFKWNFILPFSGRSVAVKAIPTNDGGIAVCGRSEGGAVLIKLNQDGNM